MKKNIVGNANGIVEGVIWKQLVKFFFPILLGAFFQQLYKNMDNHHIMIQVHSMIFLHFDTNHFFV